MYCMSVVCLKRDQGDKKKYQENKRMPKKQQLNYLHNQIQCLVLKVILFYFFKCCLLTQHLCALSGRRIWDLGSR